MDTHTSSVQPIPSLNLQEFLVSWCALLTDEDVEEEEREFTDYIEKEMGISKDMAEELETVCGQATLTVQNEPHSKEELMKDVPENTVLVNHGLHREVLKKRKASTTYKQAFGRKKKKVPTDCPWMVIMEKKAQNTDKVDIQLPDVIVTVQVYRPLVTGKSGLKLQEEFIMYGQQNLTELRDKINCAVDTLPVGEHSDNPDLTDTLSAKDMFKSGFFFIENIFYNDKRDASWKDYSQDIINWTKECDRGLGPFDAKLMEQTTLLDLSLRPGHPYLYLHQGNCEHVIVFSDIRLLHKEDCHNAVHYPIRIQKTPSRKIFCRVCQINAARWIVHNSKLSPEDPCFVCDTCFRVLHYNKQKEKLCDFKAYVLPDVTGNP